MKKLVCTKVGKNTSISKNSEYEIVSETNTRYALINDKGVQKNYCKTLFKEVQQVPPVPVAPPPPVIRTINELNVELSCDSDDNELDYSLTITSNDDLLSLNKTFSLNLEGTGISCGIHQISGLNTVFSVLNEMERLINGSLTPTLVLAEDINITEVMTTILESIIQEVIDNVNTGIILMSTNVSNNEYLRDNYVQKLNELSNNNTVTRNPNSGNDIALWNLVLAE